MYLWNCKYKGLLWLLFLFTCIREIEISEPIFPLWRDIFTEVVWLSFSNFTHRLFSYFFSKFFIVTRIRIPCASDAEAVYRHLQLTEHDFVCLCRDGHLPSGCRFQRWTSPFLQKSPNVPNWRILRAAHPSWWPLATLCFSCVFFAWCSCKETKLITWILCLTKAFCHVVFRFFPSLY